MPAPELSAVPQYYHNYIRLVSARDAWAATSNHLDALMESLEGLPEDDWHYAYADGKWSIKDLVQHVIDTERIFCHRALSIARGDVHPLPGFDENAYAAVSGAGRRSSASFLRELNALRAATQTLFESFSEEQLLAEGSANGLRFSVNAIAFVIAGHAAHHTGILQKRYLNKAYRHEEIAA